jgi:TP901 family phage tail tape measure protein
MAGELRLRISVDDKGAMRIENLSRAARKAKQDIAPLGQVMKAVFASKLLLDAISFVRNQIVGITREAAEFERAMRKVAAITGVGGKEFEEFTLAAREMSKETEHSAKNIAAAMLELTKMGMEPSETLKAMPHILDLATAGSVDLGYAAQNTKNVLNMFNMDASQTERVANVMATAFNATALDIENFMDAMRYAGSVSHTMGVSFEETVAVIGVLADAALQGSLGGTTLKNMLLNLMQPTDKVRDSILKLNTENKSFVDILRALHEDGVPVIDFLKTFDKRAIAGALATSETTDKVYKLIDVLKEQKRTSAEVAEEMRQAFILTGQQVINNINAIGISFMTALGQEPRTLMQMLIVTLQEVDDWVRKNSGEIAEFANKFMQVVNILRLLLIPVLKTVVRHLGLFLGAFALFKTVMVADKVANMSKHIIMLATGLKDATKASALFKVSMGSLVTLGAMLVGVLQNMSEEVRKQNENLEKFRLSDVALKKLTAMRDIMIKMGPYADALRMAPEGKGKQGLQTEFDALAHSLQILQKEYQQFFGKSSLQFVDTLAEIQLQVVGLTARLKQEAEAQKTVTNEKENYVATLLANLAPEEEGTKAQRASLKVKEEQIKKTQEEIDALKERIRLLKETEDAMEGIVKANDEVIDQMAEGLVERIKKHQEEIEDATAATLSIAQTSAEAIESIANWGDQNDQRRFDARMKRIDALHERELSQAGDSSFKRQMAEERYTQKKLALEKEIEENNHEQARTARDLAVIRASINVAEAFTSALAHQMGGFTAKAASAYATAALGMIQVAYIASQPVREGGEVRGWGNDTSDTVPMRASPGEVYLTKRHVSRLGGAQHIQQMIDRGATYNNNNGVNVNINTLIGTREHAREVMRYIKLEATR